MPPTPPCHSPAHDAAAPHAPRTGLPAACLALALLSACAMPPPSPAPTATPAPAPAVAHAADTWLGNWQGVEGTWLRIAGGQGHYEVTVRDLDGERTFRGRGVSTGIRFERDGVQETLQSTNGDGTGMKWLAGKSSCLAVRPGEGWCRS